MVGRPEAYRRTLFSFFLTYYSSKIKSTTSKQRRVKKKGARASNPSLRAGKFLYKYLTYLLHKIWFVNTHVEPKLFVCGARVESIMFRILWRTLSLIGRPVTRLLVVFGSVDVVQALYSEHRTLPQLTSTAVLTQSLRQCKGIASLIVHS